MTVTRRIRSPGRARNKPLKPLRAGMPGESGEPSVTTLVCFTSPFAREAAGALGTRHSPRPLRTVQRHSGASRREIADAHLNQSAAALNSIDACPKAVILGLASRCAAARPRLRADALIARHFNGWFALLCQFWRVRSCDRPPSPWPGEKT